MSNPEEYFRDFIEHQRRQQAEAQEAREEPLRRLAENDRQVMEALRAKKAQVQALSRFIVGRQLERGVNFDISLFQRAEPKFTWRTVDIQHRQYKWFGQPFGGWVLREVGPSTHTSYLPDSRSPSGTTITNPGKGTCLLLDGNIARYDHVSPRGVVRKIVDLNSDEIIGFSAATEHTREATGPELFAIKGANIQFPADVTFMQTHHDPCLRLSQVESDLVFFAEKSGIV